MSTFSFYSSKIVSTGEGGMVVCDDEKFAERCRNYRNLYFGDSARFEHADLGHNFRFNNVQAAIGCAQIERLTQALGRKAWLGRRYDALLADLPDLQLPPRPDESDNVYWVYGIVLGDSHPFDAEELQRRLKEKGVATRPFFLGLHEQPAIRDRGFAGDGPFPVAERLARRGLYLPSGLPLQENQVARVAEALRESISTAGRHIA